MTTSITVRTVDELEKSALNTYRAGLMRRGASAAIATSAVAKGTPIQLKIRSVAEMMGQIYANERALEDAQMADTATGDDLVRLAAVYGIKPLLGSGAAGDVVVTCSGPTTYSAGQELVSAKNKKRYRVVASTLTDNGGSVGVIGVDVGKATNLAAGEILTWVSPPGTSAVSCVVGVAGLTNGTEPDNDARLRTRLLKRLQNPPGAGNWAQLRQWAEEANASVENAYVYPAVHGPGTVHVAFTVEGTAENGYVREAPSALVTAVQTALLAQHPEPSDLFVSTVSQVSATLTTQLAIPLPVSAGGVGGGWLDAVPWPSSIGTAGTAIAAVLTASKFTVDALTAPAVGKHVAIWDNSAQVYRHAIVTAFSGSAGAYTITLDSAFPSVSVNAYVCPDAERIDDYGRVLCEQIAKLGPYTRTSGSPRYARRPYFSPDNPTNITSAMLSTLQAACPEITVAYFIAVNGNVGAAQSMPPPVRAGLNQAPAIHYPTQIGFYAS